MGILNTIIQQNKTLRQNKTISHNDTVDNQQVYKASCKSSVSYKTTLQNWFIVATFSWVFFVGFFLSTSFK